MRLSPYFDFAEACAHLREVGAYIKEETAKSDSLQKVITMAECGATPADISYVKKAKLACDTELKEHQITRDTIRMAIAVAFSRYSYIGRAYFQEQFGVDPTVITLSVDVPNWNFHMDAEVGGVGNLVIVPIPAFSDRINLERLLSERN